MLFNQHKKPFNLNSPTDTPTYIFEGTKEELRRLKAEGKLKFGENIFIIDPKVIIK